MQFPRLLLVRQNLPSRRIPDIPAEVRKQLSALGLAGRLKPKARVAIGVGSRGIHNLAVIVRNVVGYWKDAGIDPFIFPAMGSHGGATAAGQADVLAHYGVTEAAMGCPIVSQLEVVSLGKTEEGIEVFMDKAAYQADATMLVNRVKWHTDFEAGIESGLCKMAAIGIGKLAGAQRYHAHGYRMGLGKVVLAAGRHAIGSGKIIGGVAIVEDAYHDTARIDVIPVEELEQRERENLALAKSWMAKIPVDLDILTVDAIGKEISGTGMDTKVVNRTVLGAYNPWPGLAIIRRIFVRELSPLSYGNGLGIGMADMVTDRLVDSINWEATRVNALTSTSLGGAHLPLHFPTDRECIERLTPTVGRFDPMDVTFGWIRNSLELTSLALSANLRAEIERNPLLAIEGETDLDFDASGNLLSPFEMESSAVGARLK
ncbi:MAG: hypothetical protein ABSC23_13360 [Bryobacteraceae bacterium]